MIKIQRISLDDPLYRQECRLREQVLLHAVGMDIEGFRRDWPGLEERFEHFVAVFDHPTGPKVIGCALLLPDYPEAGVGKLMQMAVDPQRHGEGIGRRLVVALESRAFGELGLRELFCHARQDAIGFYARLGWTEVGEMFEEVGIPHRKLVLSAGAPEHETSGHEETPA